MSSEAQFATSTIVVEVDVSANLFLIFIVFIAILFNAFFIIIVSFYFLWCTVHPKEECMLL
jgi:hypothetical protein